MSAARRGSRIAFGRYAKLGGRVLFCDVEREVDLRVVGLKGAADADPATPEAALNRTMRFLGGLASRSSWLLAGDEARRDELSCALLARVCRRSSPMD